MNKMDKTVWSLRLLNWKKKMVVLPSCLIKVWFLTLLTDPNAIKTSSSTGLNNDKNIVISHTNPSRGSFLHPYLWRKDRIAICPISVHHHDNLLTPILSWYEQSFVLMELVFSNLLQLLYLKFDQNITVGRTPGDSIDNTTDYKN